MIFPYEFHFRSINTHLLADEPLSGDLEHDRQLVLKTLASGRLFIGYDLPAPTYGFRFIAHGFNQTVQMGEEIASRNGVTFQIKLPKACEIRLMRNGQKVLGWEERLTCTHITSEPGIYRVEAYIEFKGKKRGWIFSNPIYARQLAAGPTRQTLHCLCQAIAIRGQGDAHIALALLPKYRPWGQADMRLIQDISDKIEHSTTVGNRCPDLNRGLGPESL